MTRHSKGEGIQLEWGLLITNLGFRYNFDLGLVQGLKIFVFFIILGATATPHVIGVTE